MTKRETIELKHYNNATGITYSVHASIPKRERELYQHIPTAKLVENFVITEYKKYTETNGAARIGKRYGLSRLQVVRILEKSRMKFKSLPKEIQDECRAAFKDNDIRYLRSVLREYDMLSFSLCTNCNDNELVLQIFKNWL